MPFDSSVVRMHRPSWPPRVRQHGQCKADVHMLHAIAHDNRQWHRRSPGVVGRNLLREKPWGRFLLLPQAPALHEQSHRHINSKHRRKEFGGVGCCCHGAGTAAMARRQLCCKQSDIQHSDEHAAKRMQPARVVVHLHACMRARFVSGAGCKGAKLISMLKGHARTAQTACWRRCTHPAATNGNVHAERENKSATCIERG